MPKSKEVKYVRQTHQFGCVPACISMILDIDYDKVVDTFYNDFDKCGINNNITNDYLSDYNHTVVFIDLQHIPKMDKAREVLHRPFADIHLVSVKPHIDDEVYHSIIMDYEGKIFDPHDEDSKSLDKYYTVQYIFGVFYND
jgi:hypothetical protein